jgi:hypothetical protein
VNGEILVAGGRLQRLDLPLLVEAHNEAALRLVDGP